ncbi:MAG: glycosyltransferase family 8 protein [Planctomycetaceae bacterium]|nr:glycosyltransferase family 8 protein [Planctomycetaceae bacterium]
MQERTKTYNVMEETIEPASLSANVPVIFCCDANYFPHAMTLVASIISHSSPARMYDLLLFIDKIDYDKLCIAQEWMKQYPNACLRFVDISKLSDKMQLNILPTTARLTTAMYFRLLAPAVLKNYHKAVYLDVDIICLDDIALLFEEDLAGFLAGGCEDILLMRLSKCDSQYQRYWKESLRLKPGSFYFNSGVLLMDLEAMRKDCTVDNVIEMIHTIPDLMYLDQDALNVAMKGRIKEMPARWNCYDWFDEQMTALDETVHSRIVLPRETIGCHHFIGKKPWSWDHLGNNADLYWEYAAETPFHEEMWRALQRQCSIPKMIYLYGKYSVQLINAKIRHRLASANKKKKFVGRMTSILSKRRAIVKNMWKIRFNKLSSETAEKFIR